MEQFPVATSGASGPSGGGPSGSASAVSPEDVVDIRAISHQSFFKESEAGGEPVDQIQQPVDGSVLYSSGLAGPSPYSTNHLNSSPGTGLHFDQRGQPYDPYGPRSKVLRPVTKADVQALTPERIRAPRDSFLSPGPLFPP